MINKIKNSIKSIMNRGKKVEEPRGNNELSESVQKEHHVEKKSEMIGGKNEQDEKVRNVSVSSKNIAKENKPERREAGYSKEYSGRKHSSNNRGGNTRHKDNRNFKNKDRNHQSKDSKNHYKSDNSRGKESHKIKGNSESFKKLLRIEKVLGEIEVGSIVKSAEHKFTIKEKNTCGMKVAVDDLTLRISFKELLQVAGGKMLDSEVLDESEKMKCEIIYEIVRKGEK